MSKEEFTIEVSLDTSKAEAQIAALNAQLEVKVGWKCVSCGTNYPANHYSCLCTYRNPNPYYHNWWYPPIYGPLSNINSAGSVPYTLTCYNGGPLASTTTISPGSMCSADYPCDSCKTY